MAIAALKFVLSAGVALALAYPFFYPETANGILKTVHALGWGGMGAIVVGFLALILFYCRDLQRLLQAVAPSARTASPRSVWWMLAIPYNFIEDFFIISHVSTSIRRQAALQPELGLGHSSGAITGFAWCALQIVSLVPNRVGEGAGLLAAIFWIAHWRFIKIVLHRLSM